jgi:hypothetical protein
MVPEKTEWNEMNCNAARYFSSVAPKLVKIIDESARARSPLFMNNIFCC